MPSHAAHYHLRLKRLTKRQQRQVLKRSVLAVAIIEPAMTVPQIYEVWGKHHTEGVSIATWSMYIGAAAIWLIYGLQLKNKPLIVSSILFILTEAAIVAGVVYV